MGLAQGTVPQRTATQETEGQGQQPSEPPQEPEPPQQQAQPQADQEQIRAGSSERRAEETIGELEQRLRQVEEKLGRLDKGAEATDEDAEAAAAAQEESDRASERAEEQEQRARERSERRRNRYERRVSVGDRVRVRKGETVSEVVAAGGAVEIEGSVEGDVTSWGGDVTIDGSVGGDVKAYSADIELKDDADVLGSVISYGGQIDRDPDASVLGVVDERSFGASFGRDRDDLVFDDAREQRLRRSSRVVRWSQLLELAWLALGLSMLFLLAAFTLLVAPDPMERLRRTIGQDLWKSGLVGLAVVVSAIPIFFIVIVLLTVLLIGIPLIPVVVFLYMLAGFVAVVAAAYALGRRLSDDGKSPYWSLAIGSFLLVFPLLAAEALSFLSFLDPLAILMKVVGWMLLFAAGTIGIGALMLTSFGTRSSWSGGTPGFVPPPPPPPSPRPAAAGTSGTVEKESDPLDAILEENAPVDPAVGNFEQRFGRDVDEELSAEKGAENGAEKDAERDGQTDGPAS